MEKKIRFWIDGLNSIIYAVVQNLEPSNFGQVYVAYGQYICISDIWGK